ncbi:Protease 4 [bacterium HR37]|nr:Protease 4 [bacterium HR37]
MIGLFKSLTSARQYNFIELELGGEIPEEEERVFIPFFPFFPRKRKLTIWDLERLFWYASINPKILGVLIKIRGLKVGLARAEAIRRGIRELREVGKRVFIYVEEAGNIEYLIASAGEKVFLPRWSVLNLIGLKAEVTFFKDMLDKLGIKPQTRVVGDYKSAVEMFTRNSMSDFHRQMLESVLEDIFTYFVRYVAEDRGIDEKRLKELIDSGPFTSEEALNLGLVDGVLYEGELERKIEDMVGVSVEKISATAFLRMEGVKEFFRSVKERIKGEANTVALLVDSGIITLGESKGGGGTKTLGSRTVVKILQKIADDKSIKALIYRVSTPGGSGIASDLICSQLRYVSEKKPVIVSMSDVAASGGYLIALGAKRIVAEGFTLTGSIGIIGGKFNVKGFLNRVGITKEWILRGKRAMMFSLYKEFSKEEEQRLADILNAFYKSFIQKVASARGILLEEVESLAQGRVWTGRQAKELGLVDEIGGIRKAIDIAKREAGIPEGVTPFIRLVAKPRGIQIMPFSRDLGGKVEISPLFLEILDTLERERFLALMPVCISIS